MKNNFTLIWSFRNRFDILSKSIRSAHFTCSKDVDFCLVDAASNEDTIKSLRILCNELSNEDRSIRICESSYRTTLVEAWNLGMMLTDNRYVIFASSDVVFLNGEWFTILKNAIMHGSFQYVLLENHSVFGLDKKAIPKMGWFDETFVNGPHFDPDLMIRATENNVSIIMMHKQNSYTHGDTEKESKDRHNKDITDRLPMNDLTNERVFKEKWASSWPGWENAIKEGRVHLPHPPVRIDEVQRKRQEIDPHPFYTKKYL